MNPSEPVKYILDTNILIGFSTWLPIDLNLSFWNFLEKSLTQGDWILLDVVVNEVRGGDVKTWCQKQKKAGLVKNITDKGRVDSIEINNNYQMINQTTFKSEGDTFIIAYAKNNNLGIFSMESPRTGENELFKIPDVCTIFNIPRTKNTSVFLKSISYKA